MIRIGLVGFGHLGRIHLKVLQDLPAHFSVVGVYDQISKDNPYFIKLIQPLSTSLPMKPYCMQQMLSELLPVHPLTSS